TQSSFDADDLKVARTLPDRNDEPPDPGIQAVPFPASDQRSSSHLRSSDPPTNAARVFAPHCCQESNPAVTAYRTSGVSQSLTDRPPCACDSTIARTIGSF